MTLTARDPRAPFVLTPPVMSLERRARGYDIPLALIALVLSLIGALLVWAATRDQQIAQGANPQAFLYRHLFNVVIATGLMLAAARLDARLLRLFGPVVYLASLGGLVAVFAVGTTINGAKAWIRVGGGFELQPSEFMKLGLIVGMAVLFTRRADERRSRSDRADEGDEDEPPSTTDVVFAIGLIAVPLGLIMLQPDLGSAMVLACATFGVLVAAGVRARWTIGLIALGVLAAIISVKAGVLQGYQLDRVTSFTHPNHDVQGAAYNVTQAHIAIADGGLFGTGLFQGPQTNGGFVPEQQTDFIFSVAGEEFGLFGGGLVVALFGALCWRGLRIARDADDAGRLVAVGIVCWFAFQAFQNIGMNLGLTPVTGVPLPFVSYGGSSMFAQGLAIGLLQAVHRRSLD
ncbi:MAG: rod shape determining protein RodA [Pseudonocardiales bacterium]|jgi:rod shape determining protein RodA|nr:rod shape determining protein RodA [Pseudonocardiales bacterium]